MGLGAAVWVEIAAGSAYTFPLYSPSLKSVLGFNQQQLTILGVASDIGENVGILPGIACNKFPPWAVLLVGFFLPLSWAMVFFIWLLAKLFSPCLIGFCGLHYVLPLTVVHGWPRQYLLPT